jgi:hypothetical protein
MMAARSRRHAEGGRLSEDQGRQHHLGSTGSRDLFKSGDLRPQRRPYRASAVVPVSGPANDKAGETIVVPPRGPLSTSGFLTMTAATAAAAAVLALNLLLVLQTIGVPLPAFGAAGRLWRSRIALESPASDPASQPGDCLWVGSIELDVTFASGQSSRPCRGAEKSSWHAPTSAGAAFPHSRCSGQLLGAPFTIITIIYRA